MELRRSKTPMHPEGHGVRAISSQQHRDLMHRVVKSEAPLTMLPCQLHQHALVLDIQNRHHFPWGERMVLSPPQGMRHAHFPAKVQTAEHEGPVREMTKLDFSGGARSKDLPVLLQEADLEFEPLLGQEANLMEAWRGGHPIHYRHACGTAESFTVPPREYRDPFRLACATSFPPGLAQAGFAMREQGKLGNALERDHILPDLHQHSAIRAVEKDVGVGGSDEAKSSGLVGRGKVAGMDRRPEVGDDHKPRTSSTHWMTGGSLVFMKTKPGSRWATAKVSPMFGSA